MKEMFLLCNAHLDPVWLWQRQEGKAEAISTFRVAAKFCEEYNGFVFNHNESLLYEWVEEHEPELFVKIQKLVKEGKWHIMGGWYLQPDCLMPSGESFIRQIRTGNDYFMEKFGVKPETAINFDAFGHSRGLVQILSKSGYTSYMHMRPYDYIAPDREFIWKGYDGSEIICHNTNGAYNTNKGKIIERLESKIEDAHDGANLMLWGIGNHGGGPSKIDLDAIYDYAEKHPEVKLIHSTPEQYFKTVEKNKLKTVETSIQHCMIGCYTSMVRIKQLHRLLENELGICEKMIAASGISYDKNQLAEAEKALMFCEFHDILPGTMIRKAEDDAIRLLGYGREIVSRLCDKAFFELCKGQKECKQGEIPILVFNPHPYPVTEAVDVEFQLEDQNWNDNETTLITVRDENGNYIPAQNEKEASSERLDWRKRVAFTAKLAPMSISRFDCELTTMQNMFARPINPCNETDSHFIIDNGKIVVHINKNTGLIDKYEAGGRDYLNAESGRIDVYADNEDPWAMNVDGFFDKIGEFKAVTKDEANVFNGYPDANHENVRVVENGDVRCKIQAVLKHNNSFAVVTYIIPKTEAYVDIKIKVLANDSNVMYKLSFDTTMKNADYVGQMAFGRESIRHDGHEASYQKWCALVQGDTGFAVLNRGTYGGSSEENIMNISLMRTPVYSAHPIFDRPVTDDDRNHDHIDIGEREFEYRLTADVNTLDKDAEIFNQSLYALSFYPPGFGEKKDTSVELDNDTVLLTGMKESACSGLIVRLFNTTDANNKANIKIKNNSFDINFTPFEVKTFIVKDSDIKECNILGR